MCRLDGGFGGWRVTVFARVLGGGLCIEFRMERQLRVGLRWNGC